MKLHGESLLALGLAAVTLVACGSAGGATPATTTAGPTTIPSAPSVPPSPSAPAPSVVAVVAAPSPIDTTNLTCKDFDKAAPQVVSALHALAQYLSTSSDAGPNLAELSTGMGVLNGMAPKCAPKAVEALAAMSVASANVAAVYDTGSDPAIIEADKKVLDATKVAGLVAWKAMGLDVTPWDTALHYYY